MFFFFFQIGRCHEIFDPPHARSVGAQPDAAEAAGQGGEGGDGQAGDSQQVRNTYYPLLYLPGQTGVKD